MLLQLQLFGVSNLATQLKVICTIIFQSPAAMEFVEKNIKQETNVGPNKRRSSFFQKRISIGQLSPVQLL